MDEDRFNIELRKFLKEVGVTSQREIERLAREGQMQGGTAQGMSIGLYEGMHFAGGALTNANFLEYVFPRTADLPPIEAVIVEHPSVNGPFGARIVGEPPITAGAAAVANAVRDATGVRVTELPVTSEALWRLMQAGD